jgi:phosphatidylglycerol---prolipoprotein diacylglyceryl transferase
VHPVLFTLPSWLPFGWGGPLSTYGFMITLATLAAAVWGVALGRRGGVSWMEGAEIAFVAVVGGMVGSKVFHTLFEADGHVLQDGSIARSAWQLLRDDPLHWARLFDPGAVFYGGIIGGVVAGLLMVWRRGISFALAFDCAAPGIALGILLGRLGCYAGGCCYGNTTDVAWAVHFPATHETHGAAVHPVQLYDAAVGLCLLAVVLFWQARTRQERAPRGTSFLWLAGLYAVARALTETLRADSDRGLWGPLSTSQWTSVAVVAVVAAVALRRARSQRTKATAAAQ